MTKFHAASGLRGLSLTNCSFPYSIHVQTFSCNMQIYTYLHSSTKFRCHVVNKKITPTRKIVRNLHYIQQRFKRSCANKKTQKTKTKNKTKKKRTDWWPVGRTSREFWQNADFYFYFFFVFAETCACLYENLPVFLSLWILCKRWHVYFFFFFFYDSKAFHGVGPRRFQVNPILSMVILYQLSETTRAIFD